MADLPSGKVIKPTYSHFLNLPNEEDLFNPLMDVPSYLREENELVEFYKLCNEYYSPEFGIKYLMGVNLYPYQMAIIRAILGHKFPLLLLSRGLSKTFSLATIAVYYAIMNPGSKVVLVSATLRQSKLIFDEIKKMYNNSPLLRAISKGEPTRSTDSCYYEVGESTIKALPMGDGNKIRGERGHLILADEFNSVPIDVFDVVVRGFAATQSDPFDKTRHAMLKQLNEEQKNISKKDLKIMSDFMLSEGNKIVLSGTAGFKNGSFYRMYNQYSKILAHKVKGSTEQYGEIFEDIGSHHEIDYNDYCIIRMTYLDSPLGMMEKKIIDNARATMPKFIFDMEYMGIFADESFGFFKMKDINAATSSKEGFGVALKGLPNRHYVLGIDPARSYDRFAITVVELGSPNKIVYNSAYEDKTYSHSASKIRELMHNFNVVAIAMDSAGGGLAVEEILNSSDVMKPGDRKILRFDNETHEAGDRMLYMINFSSSWIEEANALLQKNIEDKIIMFPCPFFSSEFSEAKDDVQFNIEEMKKELVAIEVTHTKTGKKHFDLSPPEINQGGSEIIYHKDRYSSLLLANYIASRKDTLASETVNKEKILKEYHESTDYLGYVENI